MLAEKQNNEINFEMPDYNSVNYLPVLILISVITSGCSSMHLNKDVTVCIEPRPEICKTYLEKKRGRPIRMPAAHVQIPL